METSISKRTKAEIEILVKFKKEEFQKELEEAAKEVSKELKIPGFRSGKVPFDVLEKEVGREAIIAQAIDMIIPKALTEVFKKEKAEVIARPKIDIISNDPLEFKALAPIYPEVKVDGYEKVKVKSKEVKVDDKDIEEAIENMKKQLTTWKEILQPIKKGHKVELDFEGTDDGGAPLEGTSSKNHPMIIGENMMVVGFEDNLIGMKTGEEKDFVVTFPKDYHKKTFQNKEVKFHVKINKVEEPESPEVNEEFTMKILGKPMKVDEFREKIKEELATHKQSEGRKDIEQELLEKFLGVTKVDVSEILIEQEVEYMLEDMKHDMSHKGLKFENYLEHIKKTEEELRKELRQEGEKRIKIRFGLHEIMEKEEIKVSEEDIKNEMVKYGEIDPEKMHQARGQVTNALKLNQLFDRFIQK